MTNNLLIDTDWFPRKAIMWQRIWKSRVPCAMCKSRRRFPASTALPSQNLRFQQACVIILDGTTVYHVGASLKDAGKKCFAISLMEASDMAAELISKLQTV